MCHEDEGRWRVGFIEQELCWSKRGRRMLLLNHRMGHRLGHRWPWKVPSTIFIVLA